MSARDLANFLNNTPGCNAGEEDIVLYSCNGATLGHHGSMPYAQNLSEQMPGRYVTGGVGFGWFNEKEGFLGFYPYKDYGSWPNRPPEGVQGKPDKSFPSVTIQYKDGENCNCFPPIDSSWPIL
jgi:hypothetical protein